MSDVSKKLAAKLEADKLTPAQAAEKIGVSIVSLRGVLSGKSTPNARSIGKYAKYIGISTAEIRPEEKKAKTTGKRRGRPPGSGTGKRRGRPPGSGRGGNAGAALASIGAALKSAEAILADGLAMRVHQLNKSQRSIIEALVKGI